MAESESIDCPCSNIAIMQLFHELKQSYPTVPDQIVSKVIQENYHDKSACETILQQESHAYLQSYPGAIISGNPRENLERGSLCTQCPASRPLQPSSDVTHPPKCAMSNNRIQPVQMPQKQENAFSSTENGSIYPRKKSDTGFSFSNKPKTVNSREKESPKLSRLDQQLMKSDLKSKDSPSDEGREENIDLCKGEDSIKENLSESYSELETKVSGGGFESSSLNSSRTCCSECDSERKLECSERSHSSSRLPGCIGSGYNEVETVRWNVADGGRISGGSSVVVGRPVFSDEMSVHNYQVAVQYSMQPALPLRPGAQQRSFTTVNLSLRPPSSEPQPPIEIQSGQNLTYTTSLFDAKKGVQSQLQIRIGPGGGGTVSACRTYISSPQSRFFCRSPCCTPQIPAGFQCQNNHHLKALLEKQKERKDLLARELRREKEKLRSMQSEVRVMKAAISQKPSPHVLPKLKSEIERLRVECERLTAAVDLYSDTQTNLPLGETDEEFYRNIYTGQRLQREGSWSCQLCTFRNHPLLSVCEECEMPRISLGTQVMDVTSHLSVLSNNNTTLCTDFGSFEPFPFKEWLLIVNKRAWQSLRPSFFSLDFFHSCGEEGHPHPRHSSLPPFKNGEQLGGVVFINELLKEFVMNSLRRMKKQII